jgi:hypothetical protein
MAQIHGIAGMSPQEISFEVNRGGRFVVYRYCFSAIVLTVMQGTNIYFIRSGESRISRGLPWTLLTLLVGWWGIPWGPIRTVHSLWTNFNGGLDVTASVAGAMGLEGVNWDAASAGKS